LSTTDNQLGFKPKRGTDMYILLLKQTVSYVEFVLAPQHETPCDPETTTKEDFDYLRKIN